MREGFSTAVGFLFGVISWGFGGFDTPVLALVICMGVDYLTGLIVAGVFHASPKSSGGGLDSRVGWRGLTRKFVTMLIVVVANLADMLLEANCIRDAAIIGFCANECISVLENAGSMGIRIPKVLVTALDALHNQSEQEGNLDDGTGA